jgi:hypothetical protein
VTEVRAFAGRWSAVLAPLIVGVGAVCTDAFVLVARTDARCDWQGSVDEVAGWLMVVGLGLAVLGTVIAVVAALATGRLWLWVVAMVGLAVPTLYLVAWWMAGSGYNWLLHTCSD